MTVRGVHRLLAVVTGALSSGACGGAPPPDAPPPTPPAHDAHRTGTAPAASRADARDPVVAAEPAPPPSATSEAVAPPAARFEALPVAGHLDAVVALPAANGPQPILFATHGAGGAPEYHCAAWRRQLGERGIVVCPRGAMINRRIGPDAGFYYPNHFALEKEVLATVESFEAAYAAQILPESYVYAGYSQGATMGALMLPAHAGRFKRVVLVEGGFDAWALSSARHFARSGGERVAFVCGVAACHRGAENSVRLLARADVSARNWHAPGAGHTYLGAVADRIQEAFRWLVDDDPGWQPTLPPG